MAAIVSEIGWWWRKWWVGGGVLVAAKEKDDGAPHEDAIKEDVALGHHHKDPTIYHSLALLPPTGHSSRMTNPRFHGLELEQEWEHGAGFCSGSLRLGLLRARCPS
ncbi:hypothetical protein COCNU_06G003800 [Cocos nucifera]|uniref:Uncharacterized protein n=1 Tax=Cocos nucifera TaxID=13894 RepID=A0A8K0N2G9_COCNU|nr:hypothetical protein COCNU_06G003800 [Cocos nucifera]